MTRQTNASLFDGPNLCNVCHRALPKRYLEDTCPACKEHELFSRVKDYIRANDVTEYQVAEHFEIPHYQVKRWIREGRIEYKELIQPKVESMHCQNCGEPIRFGSLCSKCQRQANTSGTAAHPLVNEDDRFRFL